MSPPVVSSIAPVFARIGNTPGWSKQNDPPLAKTQPKSFGRKLNTTPLFNGTPNPSALVVIFHILARLYRNLWVARNTDHANML